VLSSRWQIRPGSGVCARCGPPGGDEVAFLEQEVNAPFEVRKCPAELLGDQRLARGTQRCRRRTKIVPDIVVYEPSRVLPVAASGCVLQRARPDADVSPGVVTLLTVPSRWQDALLDVVQTERAICGRAAWRSPRVSRRLAATLLANRGVCRAPVRHLASRRKGAL
jgi:hypothetical protein